MRKLIFPIAIVAFSTQIAMAQERTINGRVVDDTGEPLAGASIVIKGTQIGTATDENGRFSISVPDDKTVLVIGSFGMVDQEILAGNGQGLTTIKMANTKSDKLNDVVITALGVKKEKKSLGYSVSEVGSDLIEKSGERNAIQSLAAKAPGVQVTSTAGTPGASSKIQLRGNSTFTGSNAPLVVLDGVPY